MAVPNIGTPRTLAGEESFDGDTQTTPVPDMASSMMRKSTSFPERDNSHHSNRLLSTPRLHKSAGQGEFTPLMKSVMKNNLTRSHANSPGGSARRRTGATPRARTLDVIGEDSMEGDTQSTPVPDIASSMMQGTPLAERDNNLIGDGQAMTLKEQEQVINRVDKENFSLKLKVHFLEQRLRKAGDANFEAEMHDLPAKEQIIYESAKKEKNLKITIRELKRRVLDLERENHDAKSKHSASTPKDTLAPKLREEFQDLRNELLQSQRSASELRNRNRDLENAALSEIQRSEQLEKQNKSLRDAEKQLNSRESAHAEEVASLKDEISDLEYALRQKEQASEELAEKENVELSHELKSVRRKHTEEVNSLRTELESVRDMLRQKERAFDELAERKNIGSQELSDELRSVKQRHAEEESGLQDLVRQLKSRIADLETENRDILRTELESVRDMLRQKERAFDDLAERKNIGSQELSDELRSVKQRHAEEESGLQDLVRQLKSRIADLETENRDIRAREREKPSISPTQNRKLEDETRQLKKDLIEWGRTARDLRNQNHTLQERLREAERADDMLRQKERAFDELAERKNIGSQELSDELRSVKQRHEEEESGLQDLVRQLKSRIADLETENRDIRAREREKPSISPTQNRKLEDETRQLKKDLIEWGRTARDLRNQNHTLQERLREAERADVRDQLKAATLEAESLVAQLSERDARVQSLRKHLERMRAERSAARTDAEKIKDEMTIVRRLQTANCKERDALREDFGALESQYAAVVEELYQQQSDKRGRHVKEFQGLAKEIQWLRAKLQREERFRTDLVYSKGFMELEERVRVACNETDLRMIQEMNVNVPRPELTFNVRQKFRAAIWAVVFISRSQRLKNEWMKSKSIGLSLGRAKSQILKNRLLQKGSS